MATKLMTKRGFILSQPLTLPAIDVVKRGAAHGLAFTTGYVYVTRSDAKLNGKLSKAPKPNKAVERTIILILARTQKEILALLKRAK